MTPAPDFSALDWAEVVEDALHVAWPTLPDGRAWILAQIAVESGGDPRAESHCGARGLMQLCSDAAAEVGCVDAFEPRQNVLGGVVYLRSQYRRLVPRIPDHADRLSWAFAAYNGGMGYVLRALELAKAAGLPDWWRWEVGSRYLADPACRIERRGRSLRPDHRQITEYVARIRQAKAKHGARP